MKELGVFLKKLFPQASSSDALFLFTFYLLAVIGFLVFIVAGFIDTDRLHYLFFWNRNDIFMDFFNPLYQSVPRLSVYSNIAVIYPPFAFSLFTFLASFIPSSAWADAPLIMRGHPQAVAVFLAYMLVTVGVFLWEVLCYKKGLLWERILFVVIVLCSAPFLFQFDRANLIFVVLLFLMGFVFLKDSPKSWQLQAALLCLAAAANIKFYPAVFGLLLLREKRWDDILRVTLYSLTLFIAPFFLYGGLGRLTDLYSNLKAGVSHTNTFGFGFFVDLHNTLRLLYYLAFGAEKEALFKVYSYLGWFFLLWGGAATLFVKARWKAVALVSCLMILIPGISYFYTLIFLLIPGMLFLDDNAEKTKKDYLYLILFLLMLVPVYPGKMQLDYSYFPVYTNMFVPRLAVVVLFFLLLIDGTKDGWQVFNSWFSAKKGRRDE